jgi:apolipoprotein N-acyltransferase
MFSTDIRRWQVPEIHETNIDDMTFYTRFGDVFIYSCLILIAGVPVVDRVRRSGKKKSDAE